VENADDSEGPEPDLDMGSVTPALTRQKLEAKKERMARVKEQAKEINSLWKTMESHLDRLKSDK
jgi:hypothetical protein